LKKPPPPLLKKVCPYTLTWTKSGHGQDGTCQSWSSPDLVQVRV
jgi:hypothetical protein